MTHDELREMVPIYALDALAGDEELEVQVHLETCVPCRTLLEAHVQTASALALTAEPIAPPPALRQRLMDAAAKTPQAAPILRPAAREPHPRPFGWRRLSAIVAVAALIALGALAYHQSRLLDQRNKTLAAQTRFLHTLSNPLASSVPLNGTGNATAASAELYVAPDGHTAGLVASGLPNPGKDVYQLWLIVNNVPSPVQAFRPDASGVAVVQINANLSRMQGMAVTQEARAGNAAPQGPFVLHT